MTLEGTGEVEDDNKLFERMAIILPLQSSFSFSSRSFSTVWSILCLLWSYVFIICLIYILVPRRNCFRFSRGFQSSHLITFHLWSNDYNYGFQLATTHLQLSRVWNCTSTGPQPNNTRHVPRRDIDDEDGRIKKEWLIYHRRDHLTHSGFLSSIPSHFSSLP